MKLGSDRRRRGVMAMLVPAFILWLELVATLSMLSCLPPAPSNKGRPRAHSMI